MGIILRTLRLDHLGVVASFNTTLILSVSLIALSQFNYGFDQQGFNTTQAMNQFARRFGSYDTTKKRYELDSAWLSLFTGIPYLGLGLGVIIGSMISKHYGRRMCMFTMSLHSLVASVIIITAKNRDQILAGRVLQYLYIGMEVAVVPIFQAEIAPKEARGLVVASYQLSLAIGGLLVSAIARATGELQGEASFRIIFGLFFVVPAIVACCIWFIPESPRWYALQDRHEDALKALTRLRSGKNSVDEIAHEMALIRAGIECEVEQGKFLEMFANKQTTKRTLVVVCVNFFLHSTGSQFGAVYGAYFIRSLDLINPFTVFLMTSAIGVVAVLFSMSLVDRIGRRKIIFFGGSIQTFGLFLMGGLGTVLNPSISVRLGVVVGMCLMVFGLTSGWAPVSHILSAEIPSMHLRDITYRSATIVSILTQFAATISLPYLLNKPYAGLGSRVGFIYGSIAVVSIVFVALCLPECRGRTLEEIDLLFASKVPLRKFGEVKLDENALLEARHSTKMDEARKGADVDVQLVERA